MWKFVFRCPSTGERVFWYVSTEAQGEKMVYDHLHSTRGHRWPQYKGLERDVDFFVESKRTFQGDGSGAADIDHL